MPREVLNPTRYRCPACHHWYGEYMKTGRLARHDHETPLTLCPGSLHPLADLPSRTPDTSPTNLPGGYTQPELPVHSA